MRSVFISRIDEEASLASVLRDWIESAFLGQVQVFVSDHGITSGDQWFQRLSDALNQAKILLVLCSPESVTRPWINFETGACQNKGIPVIPICHSGMTKDDLPKPLGFFQGLDVEDTFFARDLVRDLAKQLSYEREPRIPYEDMTTEIATTLNEISGQASLISQNEQNGFIDHQVVFLEKMGDLTKLIRKLGDESEKIAIETNAFADQANKAQENRSQDTPRYLQRIARQYGQTLANYSQTLGALNLDYKDILPQIALSFEHMLQFQSAESVEDKEAISGLLITLDEVEDSISGFRVIVSSCQETLAQMPNFQREMRNAVQQTVQQLEVLIGNVDSNIEMLQRFRAMAEALDH